MNEDKSTKQTPKKKKTKVARNDSQVAKGKLVAKGLEFDHGSLVTVARTISVDLQLTRNV